MKNLRKVLQNLGFVIGAAILVYQIRTGVLALQQKHLQFSFNFLLLFVILTVLGAIAMQMLAWWSAMKSLKVSLPIQDVFQGYLLSFLPRYIPGTIWGYISRSEWLLQQHNVSYKRSYQGSVVETLAAIVANIILVANFNHQPSIGLTFLTLMGSVLFCILVWYMFKRIARVQFPNWRFIGPAVRILFPEMELKHWLASVGYFIVVWALYGAGLDMLSSLFINTPAIKLVSSWMTFSTVYAIAWLLGFVILFAPAGLGFRELALTSLLSSQMGINFGLGSILSVLFRLILLVSELLWLGASLLVKKRSSLKTVKEGN